VPKKQDAEVPDGPEKPVKPEVPDGPEKPVKPEVPDGPEKPVKPKVPDGPEKPVKPEVPDGSATPTKNKIDELRDNLNDLQKDILDDYNGMYSNYAPFSVFDDKKTELYTKAKQLEIKADTPVTVIVFTAKDNKSYLVSGKDKKGSFTEMPNKTLTFSKEWIVLFDLKDVLPSHPLSITYGSPLVAPGSKKIKHKDMIRLEDSSPDDKITYMCTIHNAMKGTINIVR